MFQRNENRLEISRFYPLIVVAILVIVFWAFGAAGAQSGDAPLGPQSAPSMLNYQGIVKVSGSPFTGPDGYFKFAIVNAVTGDGTVNYWANDGKVSGEPNLSITQAVRDGLFNV